MGSRNAAALLSTTGALVLGIGIGALFGQGLGTVAWFVAAVGLVAHLWGMVAVHRIAQRDGAGVAAWEVWTYRTCWALIALGVVAALWQLFAGRDLGHG